MITFLQHSDPLIPHYRDGAFNFQRGALCTMDRNIHSFFFHGIAETHVAHHLCSKIPHYHAWDATAALKAKLGSHYLQTDENAWVSLWKVFNECRVCCFPFRFFPFYLLDVVPLHTLKPCSSRFMFQFVEDDGDVVFWKNAKGQAHRRLGSPSSKGSVSDSGVEINDVSAASNWYAPRHRDACIGPGKTVVTWLVTENEASSGWDKGQRLTPWLAGKILRSSSGWLRVLSLPILRFLRFSFFHWSPVLTN